MADKFWGYPRPDGQVGVRNRLLVLSTCDCSYEVAKRIAAAIPDAVAVTQFHGCYGDPMVMRQMIGIGNNPNVAAVLVVGLGCETGSADQLVHGIAPSGKPLADVVIQRDGGTIRSIERGTRILREWASQVAAQPKERFDSSRLFVALECGGSDGTSGVSANPAVGVASDMLVDAGATVVFSETGEMAGTGHLLARRAASEEVAQRIHGIIDEMVRWKRAAGSDGRTIPQGNHEGGLTTMEEKSMGSIRKAGTRTIQGVLENSLERMDRPSGPGLWIQDGTTSDVPSITHMAAIGAQIAIFTTGRGSTTGHAIVPVIKVTGNPDTYEWLQDNIDVNGGRIIQGRAGIRDVGVEIYQLLLEVASGRKTKPEALGFEDFVVYRIDTVAHNLMRACA